MMDLDELDTAILREMQVDARRTNRDIAAAVGVSPTTALDRTRSLRQRGVLHRYELERTGRERFLEDVPADPLDAGTRPIGSLPRPANGNLRDVDRSNVPAALSEPDRVRALAATNVKRPARGKGGHLGDEPPVRSPAPHRPVALAVPCVPLSGLRRRT